MSDAPRIPKGCYALPDCNGDTLICDPRAGLEKLSRLLVHWRDDLRIRLVGTYAPPAGRAETRFIRVRLDQATGSSSHHIFDKDLVTVMKIVNVRRVGAAEP